MKLRVIIGSALLILVGGLFALDEVLGSRACVSCLILAVGCLSWCEYAALAGLTKRDRGGSLPLFLVGLGGTAYFLWLGCFGALDATALRLEIAGVAGLVFLGFAVTVFRADHREGFVPLLAAILGAFLCGFFFSYMGRVYRHEGGTWLAVFVLLGVKGNDIAAYFVGTRWGRHRCIAVSPKKSLEGSLAAVVFSCAWFTAGAILAPFPLFPWPVGLAFGIIISVAAQMGDLSESLVKRFYSVKDSGILLPEFGGILDLVDSFLYCGFVFWLFLAD